MNVRLCATSILALLAFARTETARAEPLTCAQFRGALPKQWLQGFVDVPEDWAKPAGAKIKIFYYGRKQADAAEVPIVFFNGGPGQDSHSSYDAFQGTNDGKTAPLIYIDQRGTGCSTPYPNGQDVASLTRMLKYGSRAIVQDAEAVRKKLFGAKTWRAFGQSYGGYIVHRYIEVAPAGLAAAFSHGAAIYQDDADFLRLRLLAQKKATDRYFAKYPADRAALALAKSQIKPTTCFQDRSMKICGLPILDVLVFVLAFDYQWPDLHLLIEGLATQQKVALPSLVKDLILTGTRSSTILPASVIDLMESPPEAPDARGRGTCDVAFGRLAAAGVKVEDWIFNECRYLNAIQSLSQPPPSNLAQVTFVPDPFNLKAVITSTVPFYLYASKNDPLVPAGAFVDEAKALGKNVKFRYLKDSGHDGFLTEPRVWQDLADTSHGGSGKHPGKER